MSEGPAKVIFSMVHVSKRYHNRTVLEDISLSYFYGAKIGVIGLNGSGKSTLLRIIAGREPDFEGQTVLAPGYRIGLLDQEPRLDAGRTVGQLVAEGLGAAAELVRAYESVSARLAEPLADAELDALLARQAQLQEQIDAAGAWDLESRLQMAMEALRCPPDDTPVAVISGGERRRVALCRLLLQQPDILLLDEPTNHLDAESVAWLEHHLQQYPGTVIAVTHDRYFLDNVAGWILELDRGRGLPWRGNYSSWLQQKQERLAREEKSEVERQRTLARELEWMRMTPRARHQRSRARLRAYEGRLAAAALVRDREARLYIPPGPRLGDEVIQACNVSKAYGDRLLFEHLTFSVPRGAIVGVIGPNGSGKTTLFRLIVGQERPDAGELRLGASVRWAYVDQSRDSLDPHRTVWETISGGADELELGNRRVNSRAYVGRFNFAGADQQKKVGRLSGGERNRVHLALVLRQGANVILLDEPTNDLDVNTLRALEDALEGFAGCAMVISHDRWFLDRIATHILAFEGDSQVAWFEGNYQEYAAHRRRRLGEAAAIPRRLRYRQLRR